jgi:hypothetical protein
MHGQKNDRDLQPLVADGAGDLKAVAARHINIEHGDLGAASQQLPPGGFAVLGFFHDDQLRRLFDDLPQARARTMLSLSICGGAQ